MAKAPEYIDAEPVLSRWYGPDSIACHRVRIIDERNAESEFTVGANLCEPQARPPMFDRLTLTDAVFTAQTSAEDAREHFINSVGISVIPGHKIAGLVAEAIALDQGPGGSFWIVGFDFMRFRNIVVPGQEISFTGNQGTFMMAGERRPFTKNFRVDLDDETQAPVLAQHWICEVNAQGLGMVGLASAPEDMVLVLMEIGQSSFYKIRVLAGDTLRSCFTSVSIGRQQIFGNAMTYLGDSVVASQHELLLGFYPMNEIKERLRYANS